LPVKIRFRDGRVLEQWSGLMRPASLAVLQPGYKNITNTTSVLRLRAEWEADRTQRTRYPLVNRRITAELLVFIAQTGMNLSQAFTVACSARLMGLQFTDITRLASGAFPRPCHHQILQ